MSGFDENPFKEPSINDPFADPSIRRAVSSTPVNRGLEDYNPFADQGSQGTAQVRGASNPPIYGGLGSTQQPATLPTSNQQTPPPAYNRTPQQTVNTALGSTISPPLDQRPEQEWKARTEEEVRSPAYYPTRNWPPLSEKCCFQPCFYQDIEVEIRSDFQNTVRQLYRLWMFHGCVLLLNVIGGFVLLLSNGEFSTFGLGILYLILFTPFSFLCWFRPAYKAFKNDSSFNYMVFFFVFFFQLIVTAIQSIGIPGAGTCGIITAIRMFDKTPSGIFIGLLLLFVAFCFGAAAGGDLLLLTKIHRIYRSSEASVTKAQQEFTTTIFGNGHVQNAASDVVANSIRAQMSNAATPPRY